jgi:ribosomal protein S18 acetylase RimI-like enzyme
MTGEATRQLFLRAFEATDEEDLISWFATPDELRLFAGDSLRWPLDRRQLALIRSDPSLTPWTAVAVGDSQVAIGHIELTRLPQRRWFRLARVAVAPAHRGRGLGLALVNAALDEAQQRDAAGVDLRVYDSNAAARATYRSAGFTDIGRDRLQPDLRWMVKELKLR